jgi:hypothetical protein
VANAAKHVFGDEDRGKLGYCDVATHQLNDLSAMRLGWPLGGQEVLVGLDRAWRLPEVIESAMKFWRRKLGLGVDSGKRLQALQGDSHRRFRLLI